MAQRRITIKDIARIAGVSYATVSRAVSGSHEISASTRDRVLAICEAEGYRANVLARNLIRNKTNMLGLIVPDIANPFFSEIALNIEIYARSLGYHLILCNSLNTPDQSEDLFDFMLGHQVDGVLMASPQPPLQHWPRNLPVVLLGSDAEERISFVSTDNEAGGAMAASYLLSLGHRSILYVGARPGVLTHQLRLEGFRRVMTQAGLSFRTIDNPGVSSITSGQQLGKRIFSGELPETAIFAATDTIALGLLQAADEAGVGIPQDVSLLGFDNLIYTGLPRIALTTIDQRKQQLAEAAVDQLLQLIEHDCAPAALLIQPELIERSSCRSISLP